MIVVAVLILALTYAFTLGSLAWEDLVTGLLLASVLVMTFRKITIGDHPESASWTFRTLLQTPRYIGIVFIDVLKGTWQVATYVVGLKRLEHPGIIRIPYEEESEIRLGIALLALSISPGSFVVDVDTENRVILAHFIDISDPDKVRRDVHDKYFRVPGTHVLADVEPEVPNHA
jgi:multicomponent Na+:H+ antiporter subunit E